MSRIALLRHGATTAGARYCGSTDSPLSDLGWQQMWQALAGTSWTRIITSPLTRCASFARAFASEQAITCEIDPRWREMHFGDWEGSSAAELFERTPQALENFWSDAVAYPPPQSETLLAVRSRVLQAWRALNQIGDDEAILIVTHGGPIRIVLAEQRPLALQRLLEIEVPYAQLIEIQMSSVCVRS